MAPEHYTARAIKGTALLEETRALLRAWRPGESAGAFRDRVRAEDLLGKATAARSDDVVRVAFAGRLLADGDEPAVSLRHLLASRKSGPWFSQLCLLFAARADVVLREAVTEFLARQRARRSEAVTTADFLRFLDEQHSAGRMARPWSRSVRESVAQHVLHQLTDLGALGPPRRGVRALLPYRPGALATAWLTCELHRQGVSDIAIVEHHDWRIWQMHEEDVREALDRLSDLGLWIFQGAGTVVRITWTWADWATVLEVLGGPTVE
ncbi:MAG: DUF1819 family protein [Polyangiaceae bacterium]|nr:DUF1819 family protein [Polyangiaceae bacterium]